MKFEGEHVPAPHRLHGQTARLGNGLGLSRNLLYKYFVGTHLS